MLDSERDSPPLLALHLLQEQLQHQLLEHAQHLEQEHSQLQVLEQEDQVLQVEDHYPEHLVLVVHYLYHLHLHYQEGVLKQQPFQVQRMPLIFLKFLVKCVKFVSWEIYKIPPLFLEVFNLPLKDKQKEKKKNICRSTLSVKTAVKFFTPNQARWPRCQKME